ncbi:MAG: hypothetical protein S4CHLAM7_10280 [Chlamydiae bacterium]|nr:hypothetical protein [Chlamydiota bacterium]
MNNKILEEKDHAKWEDVVEGMPDDGFLLDDSSSEVFFNDQQELLNRLSYYKFASKLLSSKGSVLEIASETGLGSLVLQKESNDFYSHLLNLQTKAHFEKHWPNFDYLLNIDDLSEPVSGCCFFNFSCLDSLKGFQTNFKKYSNTLLEEGHLIVGFKKDRKLDESFLQLLRGSFHFVFQFSGVNEVVQSGDVNGANYTILLATLKK